MGVYLYHTNAIGYFYFFVHSIYSGYKFLHILNYRLWLSKIFMAEYKHWFQAKDIDDWKKCCTEYGNFDYTRHFL